MRGERTLCLLQFAMTAEASAKCCAARLATAMQASPSARVAKHLFNVLLFYAGVGQSLVGEVESSHAGILVEIPENVGHLQSAAEMVREFDPLFVVDPENPHREPADSRSDAIAIKFERLPIGSSRFPGAGPSPCHR